MNAVLSNLWLSMARIVSLEDSIIACLTFAFSMPASVKWPWRSRPVQDMIALSTWNERTVSSACRPKKANTSMLTLPPVDITFQSSCRLDSSNRISIEFVTIVSPFFPWRARRTK